MEIKEINYGFKVDRTIKRIKQELQKLFNTLDFGITVDQWVILDQLQQRNGLGQHELANETFKDAPTVTRIIDLLCQKGLTERRLDTQDRRRFRVYLTEQGIEKINHILPIVEEVRMAGWQNLSMEDYNHLERILDIVFDNHLDIQNRIIGRLQEKNLLEKKL